MPTGSNFILGTPNTASDPTELSVTAPPVKSGLEVRNPWGDAVVGDAFASSGVVGTSVNGSGVRGDSDNGAGVTGSGLAVGVLGVGRRGDSIGIRGTGPRGGVFGVGTATGGVGVFGSGGAAGISGSTTSLASGFGVNGQTALGVGTRGLARGINGVGVLGVGAVGGHGLVGMASAPALAGVFFGDMVVAPGGNKSAAVPFPDGSHRLLYSMECPESWFEDFGTGRLVRGRATVRLDRGFAAVVRRDQLHVFLTPEGDCRGLYVRRKSASGFEVRELQGGSSSLRFTYRVVARRKDVRAPRFARVRLPKLPPGADAPIAKGPEAPKVEARTRRFLRKPSRRRA
ncbi:MAG TPA: hypothetical protein VMI34_08695 [Candidatus Bathyarchaeia archaeon]|nr:hypothetical protein [Candidatus Bathyarchaeia archaeon]